MHFQSMSPVIMIGITILSLIMFEALVPRFTKAKLTLALVGLGASLTSGLINIFVIHNWSDVIDSGVVKVSSFSIIMTTLITIIGIIILLVFNSEIESEPQTYGVTLALILTTIAGTALLSMSNDFLMSIISLEAVSMPLLILVFWKGDRSQAGVAVKYFLYSAATSATMLFGISFIFLSTNSLRLDELSATNQKSLLYLGIALLLVGLFFKAAIFPFHGWVLDVYGKSHVFVATLLSVVSKIAAFIFLISILPQGDPISGIVFVLSTITIIFGSFSALRAKTLIELLSYSSIVNSGVLAIGFATGARLTSVLVQYLFVYSLATIIVFAYIHFGNRIKIAFVLGLFSLAGILPLAGWYPKFLIMKEVIGTSNKTLGFAVAFLVLASSVSLFISYGRQIRDIDFLGASKTSTKEKLQLPDYVINAAAFSLVIFGIFPRFLEYFASKL